MRENGFERPFDQEPDLETLRSGNSRLERVFRFNPEYLNREFVVAPVLARQPVFINKALIGGERDRSLRESIGFVLTPEAAQVLPQERRSELRVLASPYECGRTLEYDDTEELEGVPYVASQKGGGATTFARQTGAENPWMLQTHRDFTPEQQEAMRRQAFTGGYGLLHEERASLERRAATDLEKRGIDAEKILAIYRLDQIPGADGELRPVDYYKERGEIFKEIDPVILIRAMKINIRLMDVVMLDHLKKEQSIPEVLAYLKSQYASHEHKSDPTFKEYYFWLARKVIRQEMGLILDGINTSSGHWQDLGRNITGLGEEIDLEDGMKPSNFFYRTSYEYAERVGRNFECVDHILFRFGDIGSFYAGEKIDPEEYGELVSDELRQAVEGTDLAARFQKLRIKKHQPITTSEQDLRIHLLRAFESIPVSVKDDKFRDYRNFSKASVVRWAGLKYYS